MPLIVEDGTGMQDAESYVDIAEFDAYCSKMGYDYDALAQAQPEKKEAYLRRATRWLDGTYGIRANGVKKVSQQALVFPRREANYLDGTDIDPDSVPQAYKDAECEAAVMIFQGYELTVTITPGRRLKRSKIDVIEDEWFDDATIQDAVFGWLDAILFNMFAQPEDDMSMVVGRMARA